MEEHRSATAWMALAASLGAHALLVGLWLHGPARPTPESAAAAGRPRGAITVHLYAAAAPVAVAPVRMPPITPARRSQRVKARGTSLVTAPAPFAPMSPEPTVPASPAPAHAAMPVPPAAPEVAPPAPGAAFAGLFTPLLSRPLGGSAWGRGGAGPRGPALAVDSQQQREQALQALRITLLGRLSDLADRLAANGQDVRCRVAVDSRLQLAEVHCADPADRGAPWGALQGLLVAGSVPPASASLCFSLSGPQVSAAACSDDLAAPNP